MNTSARMLAGASHMLRFTHIRATMALAIVLSTIGSASANLITNGNFSANANQFVVFPGLASSVPEAPEGNPLSIPGWTWNGSSNFGVNGKDTVSNLPALPGPIGIYGPSSQQSNPDRNWVLLQGDGAAVFQIFNVTPGVQHTVSFEAATRDGEVGEDGLVIFGIAQIYDGALANFLTQATPKEYSNVAFEAASFTFTPTQSQASLVLQNFSPGLAGKTVNFANVSVVAVPEPGALALAGIGIAAVAYGFRRRRCHQRT